MSTDARLPRRPSAADGLFVVGIVGRTGSGKSTAAAALASEGAEVIEGDALGHAVTDRDPEVRAALVGEYGPNIYGADGTLDRRRVAARVFAEPAARERLDRLVHPRIIAAIAARLDALRKRGFLGVVVLDAALLLEWGLERWCDAVIAVTAPEDEQVARLQTARGWTREDAGRRLAAQRSNDAFEAAADVTLDSHGARDAFERRAREAVAALIARRYDDPQRHGAPC